MWNDNDTTIDLIDFRHLVAAAESIINIQNLLPCTIGVYGDWGSGKSSLMKMIEEKLKADKSILCLRFNGWLFEGFDDAKTVLLSTLLDEVSKKGKLGEKAKKLLQKLVKQINWMKVAKTSMKHGVAFASMGPAGLAVTSISDAIKNFTENKDELIKENEEEEPTSIRDFHENFADLLKETKIEKLVVLIDDLDRCLPDTIIETLEGIKLFLFVPNSVFVISADERLIKYAVRRRFPEIPGEGIEVGREYLEKLIQFPIRIPQLSVNEIETYIILLFAKLSIEAEVYESIRKKLINKKNDEISPKITLRDLIVEDLKVIPPELDEALLLANQITPVLTRGLSGNPRQCKRFLNTLLLRVTMAKVRNIELKRRILAKLMLLEYFKPDYFRELHKVCIEGNGVITDFKTLELLVTTEIINKTEKQTNDNWNVWIEDSWLLNWLKIEPSFVDIDLRPYYSFSRDRLDDITSYLGKMSPNAQELLIKILNQSDAIREGAIKDASNLNPSDAAAIFDSISQRIQQTEDALADSYLVKSQFAFCLIRKELIAQLILFWSKISEDLIPISLVPMLANLVKGTIHESAVNEVIKKWSKSLKNKKLSTIAQQHIGEK